MKQLVIFKHRINKISEIAALKPGWGAELDLRSHVQHKGKILIHHDAWTEGDDFESWLKAYAQRSQPGPLILNTKEDGLEERTLELLKTYGLHNYFFLDTALPTLVKWTQQKSLKNFAVRLSHYEPPEFVRQFQGKANWLWVDCFGGRPIDPEWLKELQGDFQICLVSPELQGMDSSLISDFKKLLGPYADAVCTKNPQLWIDDL